MVVSMVMNMQLGGNARKYSQGFANQRTYRWVGTNTITDTRADRIVFDALVEPFDRVKLCAGTSVSFVEWQRARAIALPAFVYIPSPTTTIIMTSSSSLSPNPDCHPHITAAERRSQACNFGLVDGIIF